MASSFSPILTVLDAFGYGGAVVASDGAVQYINAAGVYALRIILPTAKTIGERTRLPQSFLARLDAHAPGPMFLNLIKTRAYVAQKFMHQLDNSAFLLVFADLNTLKPVRPEVLQRGFGLTRCEARLATALSTGMSLREIARQVGVEIGTVRGQLKSVFIKTGTKRQPELVAILARLVLFSQKPSHPQ